MSNEEREKKARALAAKIVILMKSEIPDLSMREMLCVLRSAERIAYNATTVVAPSIEDAVD